MAPTPREARAARANRLSPMRGRTRAAAFVLVVVAVTGLSVASTLPESASAQVSSGSPARTEDGDGQVCLPGFGALVANCDVPLKQAKGLSAWTHDHRTVPLNVSAGCGHSIYAPVRFACRPEATLLTLTARP